MHITKRLPLGCDSLFVVLIPNANAMTASVWKLKELIMGVSIGSDLGRGPGGKAFVVLIGKLISGFVSGFIVI